VAIAVREVISVYNLESGDLIHELYDEGAGWHDCMAVAGERCGIRPEENVGDIVEGVWFAAGHDDGSVRIWDCETECCVTKLFPTDVTQVFHSCCVAMAPDRRCVVLFTIRVMSTWKRADCMFVIYHPTEHKKDMSLYTAAITCLDSRLRVLRFCIKINRTAAV
jgi:WD40 repeat protein